MKTTQEMIEVMQAYLRGGKNRISVWQYGLVRMQSANMELEQYRIQSKTKTKDKVKRQRQIFCRLRQWMNFWQRKESTET